MKAPTTNQRRFLILLGHKLEMQYDAHGNETGLVFPDATSDQYSYDAAGNITAWTSRRGLTTRYAYDGNNLLTATTLPDGSTRNLAYDAHRNLLSVADTTESSPSPMMPRIASPG